VGVTEDVAAALIKAARAYRKENHELPRGIAIEVDRRI
jgi:hypothetical protein